MQKWVVAIVSVIISIAYIYFGGGNAPAVPTTTDTLTVARVVDGDTIELSDGRIVRYIGVNTPESVDPRRPHECYGKEASDRNKELVLGKTVRLEKDVSDTDKYGRLLRYVYIDEEMINKTLVAEGFAQAASYPPDIAYQDDFRNLERTARTEGVGLWGACQGDAAVAGEVIREDGCVIKGNINASEEKIYHLPECRHYANTQISEADGEAWFCTEQDAIAAGFRRAGDCD